MKKRISDLNQLITQDEDEAKNIEENMKTWLIRSAEQYMQCLRLDGTSSNNTRTIEGKSTTTTVVVRLLGLLLKNPNESQLHIIVRGSLSKLHKSLRLFHLYNKSAPRYFKIRKNYKILFHSC